MYQEEDYLMVSGIQHFIFCRRQWALIHIEQQWAENYRTTDGELMHKNAHNGKMRTKRGSLLVVRAMKIHSRKLGISGECDIVEFHEDPEGITLQKCEGTWQPYPVEYKRGTSKPGQADEAQLCAQAMCLEEMLCCDISKGAIYYGQDHHRMEVEFTKELRDKVTAAVTEMHQIQRRGNTPKVKTSKSCNACSLKDICFPKLLKTTSVNKYIHSYLEEDSE